MLTDMLRNSVEADPDKTAIVQGSRRIRYGELDALVGRCAAGLRRRGMTAGDCVAVLFPNCPEFVITLFACARLRALMLPLDPLSTRIEVQRLLADVRAKLVVTDPRHADLVSVSEAVVSEFEALLDQSADPLPADRFDGTVLYLYTSGSTEERKRLCGTQRNLFYEACNFVETMGLTAADNILCTIPLHHSYGLGNCLLDAVYAGSTLVLLKDMDAPFAARCGLVQELIRSEGIRFYPGVPYQFQILATLPENPRPEFAGLKLCVSSGDVLPRRTFERFRERFGIPIRSLYGSTEAGSICIDTDSAETLQFGSLGRPLKNVEIRIRDDAGRELPVLQSGRIWVRSPVIPPTGYENRQELTTQVFRDGFYDTGDMGMIDERGHLVLIGRKQTFVDVGGYKVDIGEVEEVLQSCPGVREAAVLGVEAPRIGTLLKAALVTDGTCRPSEIWEFCRHKLAFYKVPRLIEVHPALPRSALGKVLRSELGGVESYLEEIRNGEAAEIVGRLSTVFSGKRRSMLACLVQAQVAAVLGKPITAVPRDVGFIELGMDSFGAIDLRARLEYLFDRELPQTFTFDHPTVNAIMESLMELVDKTGVRSH
jgi:long-chain acyl-CoA synthetase